MDTNSVIWDCEETRDAREAIKELREVLDRLGSQLKGDNEK